MRNGFPIRSKIPSSHIHTKVYSSLICWIIRLSSSKPRGPTSQVSELCSGHILLRLLHDDNSSIEQASHSTKVDKLADSKHSPSYSDLDNLHFIVHAKDRCFDRINEITNTQRSQKYGIKMKEVKIVAKITASTSSPTQPPLCHAVSEGAQVKSSQTVLHE
eukprot:749092-Hanusia_phi.AAC.5